MTGDLMKRLRLQYEPTLLPVCVTEDEIINRIEQLEAALREISHIHDGNPSPAMAGMPDVDYARFVIGEARRVARAALGEKKDD